jgi:predicted GTPase
MLLELEDTIAATEADVVVTGTPIALERVVEFRQPVRRARYELCEVGQPTLDDVLAPLLRVLCRPVNMTS